LAVSFPQIREEQLLYEPVKDMPISNHSSNAVFSNASPKVFPNASPGLTVRFLRVYVRVFWMRESGALGDQLANKNRADPKARNI
jgi:hypothetical protein